MANPWIEISKVQNQLDQFFSKNRAEIREFGSTVNQTFEAFVFASTVKWYVDNGWKVEFINPQSTSRLVKLKFTTLGRPSLYTYAICTKDHQRIQVRHGLRVATRHHQIGRLPSANVVLDVAVISDTDLSKYKSNDHVENSFLITFGEAKHMSAFAELVANFVGLVHELLPDRINHIRLYSTANLQTEHPSPFLYVSGYLYPTAQGIAETIKDRGYDIDVYDHSTGGPMFGVQLPVLFPKKLKKSSQNARSKALVSS